MILIKIFMKSENIIKLESNEVSINRNGDKLEGIYFDIDNMVEKLPFIDLEL